MTFKKSNWSPTSIFAWFFFLTGHFTGSRSLKVRLYRLAAADASDGGSNSKLPVLVHFHGGRYCLGSYDQLEGVDYLCRRLAADLPALVLSIQYRLAPEHHLPAAIEDDATFLAWLRGQAALAAIAAGGGGAGAEPWLAESADFARTLLSGVSADANLAHHLTVRADPPRPGAPRRARPPVLVPWRRPAHRDGVAPPLRLVDGRHVGPTLAEGGDVRLRCAYFY